MAVTIRDVAKAAGVSPATVSRAISAPEIVDATTLARVLSVADHLGYQPNRAARGLITGRTGNIGLILPDLANPFFPSVVKGIQRQAHAADYQVFVADTDEDASTELGLVRSLTKQVDGIILCSPRMAPHELREAAGLSTIVLVNRRAGSIPSIAMDNADGMAQVVAHLADLGHQRIGFVAGPRSSWSMKERRKALRAAVTQRGVELVELGHFAPTFDGGAASAEGVLISEVTAVVGYNDLVALGLIGALRDRGVDVPGDLSVVGIDNIQIAAMAYPGLTTLDIPKQEAGRHSVDLLMQLLADPAGPRSGTEELATELIVRQTTGPVRSTPLQTIHSRRTARR